MIRIAICEDETIHMKRAQQYLAKITKEHQLEVQLVWFQSGREFLECIKLDAIPFDLIFLDILLGDYTGIEIAKRIRDVNKEIPITLISSSLEYAIDGYKVSAINYLVKPYTLDELRETFNQMVNRHEITKRNTFCFKFSQSVTTLPIQKIMYFESNRRIVQIKTTTKDHYEFYAKLNDIELELADKNFIRSHQSYLINPQYIQEIDSLGITLINGDTLPISRVNYSKVKDKFIEFLSSSL